MKFRRQCNICLIHVHKLQKKYQRKSGTNSVDEDLNSVRSSDRFTVTNQSRWVESVLAGHINSSSSNVAKIHATSHTGPAHALRETTNLISGQKQRIKSQNRYVFLTFDGSHFASLHMRHPKPIHKVKAISASEIRTTLEFFFCWKTVFFSSRKKAVCLPSKTSWPIEPNRWQMKRFWAHDRGYQGRDPQWLLERRLDWRLRRWWRPKRDCLVAEDCWVVKSRCVLSFPWDDSITIVVTVVGLNRYWIIVQELLSYQPDEKSNSLQCIHTLISTRRRNREVETKPWVFCCGCYSSTIALTQLSLDYQLMGWFIWTWTFLSGMCICGFKR